MNTVERLFTVLMMSAALGWTALCFGGLFGLGQSQGSAPVEVVKAGKVGAPIELPPVQIVGSRTRVAAAEGPVVR